MNNPNNTPPAAGEAAHTGLPELHVGLSASGWRLFDEAGKSWFLISDKGDDDRTQAIGGLACTACNSFASDQLRIKKLEEALTATIKSMEWAGMVIDDIPEHSNFSHTLADARSALSHP